jgi:hypothetical protein
VKSSTLSRSFGFGSFITNCLDKDNIAKEIYQLADQIHRTKVPVVTLFTDLDGGRHTTMLLYAFFRAFIVPGSKIRIIIPILIAERFIRRQLKSTWIGQFITNDLTPEGDWAIRGLELLQTLLKTDKPVKRTYNLDNGSVIDLIPADRPIIDGEYHLTIIDDSAHPYDFVHISGQIIIIKKLVGITYNEI